MKNLIEFVIILIPVLISATRPDEETIYALVRDRVTLKSPDPNIIKDHYVRWKFGHEELAWRNPHGGRNIVAGEPWKLTWSDESLVIQEIQQEQFGVYTCEVKKRDQTILTNTYKLVRLDVIIPSSPLLPGEDLVLQCKTDDSNKPEIYWLNPQRERVASIHGKIEMKATSQHHGQWTYVVKYGEKEEKVPVSVTVVDFSPPSSLIRYTSKTSPLTIPCSILPKITWEQIKSRSIQEVYWQFSPEVSSGVVSDDPQKLFSLSLDTLQWKPDHPKGLVPVSDLKNGNLSLTRKQGREEDRGNYMCTMKFQNPTPLTRTIRVEVLQITAFPGTNLTSGQQLQLTCSIGHNLTDDLQLIWIPPDQSSFSLLKSVLHSSNFTIPAVSTGDSGKWKCELRQGGTWLTSDVITLNIKPKLSPWMLVIICSAAVIVILLLILLIILYRRRQRKMRLSRHRLCQCKHPKPKGFYKT